MAKMANITKVLMSTLIGSHNQPHQQQDQA